MAASDPMFMTPYPGYNDFSGYDECEDYTNGFLAENEQIMGMDFNFIHDERPPTPEQTDDLPQSETPSQLAKRTLPPLKLIRSRSYLVDLANDMWAPKQLAYIGSSPPKLNPPITVLLALTPHPAGVTESVACHSLALRFCHDFTSEEETWSCVSLYTHYRAWATQYPDLEDAKCSSVNSNSVSVGSIHPFALRAKLEQEKEVQWRFSVPVLLELIGKEVEKGARHLVVCGLQLGDVEGIRAFGQRVANPAGVLAFLPDMLIPTGTELVPSEYERRSVMVEPAPPSQTYDLMLAAILAKSIIRAPIRADVIDLVGSSSSSSSDGDAGEQGAMEGVRSTL